MAIKCCEITAGKMNRKVTIERSSLTTDGEGGFTETWTPDPSGGVWAWITPLSARESYFFERVIPGNRVKAVIRFRGDANGAPYYSAKDRVTFNGRTYAVESVIDIEDESRYMELMLAENKAS